MADLGAFLQRQCAISGPWNCSTLAADWCVSLGHPDFAAEWRDIVEPGPCDAVPVEAGGLVALWDRGIGNGLRVAASIIAGDIAVIRIGKHEAGAIWTGVRWAVRVERGLHFCAPQAVIALKAWRA